MIPAFTSSPDRKSAETDRRERKRESEGREDKKITTERHLTSKFTSNQERERERVPEHVFLWKTFLSKYV